LAYVTVCRERQANAAAPIDYKNVVFWSCLIVLINTFIFAYFVVDVNTTLAIEQMFG
jgi:uncharacterized YccA/Bax inhibitor family protein